MEIPKHELMRRARKELDELGERVSHEFSAGEITQEQIIERMNEFVKKLAVEPSKSKVTAKTNEDGTITFMFSSADFPNWKPTIQDIVYNWKLQASEGKTKFFIHPDHSDAWTRDDWGDELQRLGQALSKQMTASTPDPVAIENAGKDFDFFRLLAYACGHSIEFGDPLPDNPDVVNGPVSVAISMVFGATPPADQKDR
ncbi:hypothetical protein D3C71_79850 [compost metagenome]